MRIRHLWPVLVLLACSSCINLGESGPVGPPPESFTLEQNYPNPFIDTTMIQYGVPVVTNGSQPFVRLVIYDRFQNVIKVLTSQGHHTAGMFVQPWDGRDEKYRRVPKGTYIVQLEGTSPQNYMKRIVAIKQ